MVFPNAALVSVLDDQVRRAIQPQRRQRIDRKRTLRRQQHLANLAELSWLDIRVVTISPES